MGRSNSKPNVNLAYPQHVALHSPDEGIPDLLPDIAKQYKATLHKGKGKGKGQEK